jgi:lysophospholipase L1-like esterase
MKIPNFIACLGDSTTQGSDSTSIPYAMALQVLLNATYPGSYAVSNRGTGGTVVSQMQTSWTGSIKGKVGAVAKKYLVVLGGVNDCLADTAAATTYATLKAIYDDAVSAGWIVIPVAILPFFNYTGWNASRQTLATTINTSIAGYGAAIVDGYTLLGDAVEPRQLSYLGGTKPDYATKTYAGSGGGRDFLHPNDAGHAALAAAIKTAMGV